MYKQRQNYGLKNKELTENQKENLFKLFNAFKLNWFTEDDCIHIIGKRTYYNLNVLKEKGFLDTLLKKDSENKNKYAYYYEYKVNNDRYNTVVR
jgi:predicted DNA-binding ArsR family transcriptional regulator